MLFIQYHPAMPHRTRPDRLPARGESAGHLEADMTPLSRRFFIQTIIGLALASNKVLAAAAAAGAKLSGDAEMLRFSANGWVPNNPRLPVLFYRNVLKRAPAASTARIGQLFDATGWPPQWVAGIYDFHHYHSTAHEVLGVAAGHARVMLGGPDGHIVEIRAGDVVVLPVGTGHCNLGASDDFSVVGAYPPKAHWDICRAAPSRAALDRMATLSYPRQDPVYGDTGPLLRHWS